jgi:hypothetical protein
MKYTLSLYLILAIDFIVIALKVKYANRRSKNEAAMAISNQDAGGARHDLPPGKVPNPSQHVSSTGLGAN